MISEGMLPPILSVIQTDNGRSSENCWEIIRNLASEEDIAIRLVRDLRIVDIMLTAIKKDGNSPILFDCIARACWAITTCTATKKQIFENQAFVTAILEFSKTGQTPKGQEVCCACIQNLSIDEINKLQILKNSSMIEKISDLILTPKEVNPENSLLKNYASTIIQGLSQEYQFSNNLKIFEAFLSLIQKDNYPATVNSDCLRCEERAISFFFGLSTTVEENRLFLIENEEFMTNLVRLCRFENSKFQTQAYAWGVLCSLSTLDSHKDFLIKKYKVLELFIELSNIKKKAKNVLEFASDVVLHLSENNPNTSTFLETPKFIESLTLYLQFEGESQDKIKFLLCSLIQNIANEKENQVPLVEDHKITQILSTTYRRADEKVKLKIMMILWVLASEPDNRITMTNKIVTDTVSLALMKGEPKTRRYGTAVLQQLVKEDENREKLVELGVLTSVVEVLRTDKTQSRENCCMIIFSLAFESTNRVSMVQVYDVVTSLVSIMYVCSSQELTLICATLWELSFAKQIRYELIVDFDVATYLVNVMKNSLNSKAIEYSIQTIQNLSVLEDTRVLLVVDKLVVETVCDLINKYIGERSEINILLLESLCSTLQNLSITIQNRKTMIHDKNLIPIIKKILSARHFGKVQSIGCDTLKNVSFEKENKTHLSEDVALIDILFRLAKGYDTDSLKDKAFEVLRIFPIRKDKKKEWHKIQESRQKEKKKQLKNEGKEKKDDDNDSGGVSDDDDDNNESNNFNEKESNKNNNKNNNNSTQAKEEDTISNNSSIKKEKKVNKNKNNGIDEEENNNSNNNNNEVSKRGQKKKEEVITGEKYWNLIVTRVKYCLGKIRREQNLIDVYSREYNADLCKPTQDIIRAQTSIYNNKQKIRELVKSAENHFENTKAIPEAAWADDGIDAEVICCSICGSGEVTPENDILLCDREGCDRGFHQKCLDPPITNTAELPDDWFCPACDCLLDCIELVNQEFDTEFSSYKEMFPEVGDGPFVFTPPTPQEKKTKKRPKNSSRETEENSPESSPEQPRKKRKAGEKAATVVSMLLKTDDTVTKWLEEDEEDQADSDFDITKKKSENEVNEENKKKVESGSDEKEEDDSDDSDDDDDLEYDSEDESSDEKHSKNSKKSKGEKSKNNQKRTSSRGRPKKSDSGVKSNKKKEDDGEEDEDEDDELDFPTESIFA
eukprot:c21967_g2_i1.p1 GENE.c21967_g2_i1~~c21967_g2_i1.p1  ORF type:complete len:1277 (-),score=565.81 c21967_g2_i1:1087-4641(-)